VNINRLELLPIHGNSETRLYDKTTKSKMVITQLLSIGIAKVYNGEYNYYCGHKGLKNN